MISFLLLAVILILICVPDLSDRIRRFALSLIIKSKIDPVKLLLLVVVLVVGSWAARDNLNFDTAPKQTIEIQEPASELKTAVQPLVKIKANNPRMAEHTSRFLAAYAWLISHGDIERLNSEQVSRQLERGATQVYFIEEETLDGFSDAINNSLDNLWGVENRSLTKDEVAEAIYAAAWALQ